MHITEKLFYIAMAKDTKPDGNQFEAPKLALKIDRYDKIAYNYLGRVYEKLNLPRLDKPAAALRYPASLVDIE